MTAVEVLFVLLGCLAVGAGLLVAVGDNLVHCALWLVVSLGSIAGLYLLLAAEFVAWVQVLIYLGAVVVLLLFALMLTRAPTGDQAEPVPDRRQRLVGGAVGTLTAIVLLTTVVAGFSGENLDIHGRDIGSATAIGGSVFGAWVLAFEIVSLLLLAALVGAIALSRRPEREG